MGVFDKGQKERSWETLKDEQAAQSAANKLGEQVVTHARDNDWNAYAYERLRLEELGLQNAERRLQIAEREQALREARNRESERATERANREYTLHAMNAKHNDHYTLGFDKQLNIEPSEAKSHSEILSGYDLQALRGIVSVAVAEAFKRYKEDIAE